MTKPDILFMGTPSFAIPALDILHTRNYPLIGVVTQPDSSQGRGQKKIAPPVKTFAQKLGLPIFQPENIIIKWSKEKITWQPKSKSRFHRPI